MGNNGIELADVFARFIEPYRERYGPLMLPSQRRAVRDILACMTPAMGGGRYRCRECAETFWCYHGCRNRACPKCHGGQIAGWMEKRTAELLPCGYFHLIATIPSELRRLFLREQKLCYGLLMHAVSSAVCELAKDKRYLGAVPAILAVLHTWTGQLRYHPHLHLLVSGGGLAEDGITWHEPRHRFLVPVKKLSRLISRRFAQALEKKRPELFAMIPSGVWKREWCAFCKHAGTGRDAVLRYLARYVFRVAITKTRIVAMDQTHVTFRYKENDTGRWKTERITGVEFMRRFLLHVLPRGFHKVRYYGLWSAPHQARHHAVRLKLQLLQKTAAPDTPVKLADLAQDALASSTAEAKGCRITCPHCNCSNVECLERVPRGGAMVT